MHEKLCHSLRQGEVVHIAFDSQGSNEAVLVDKNFHN